MNARAIVERVTVRGVEVVLQVRDKPGQSKQLELPGGQVEEFESLVDALVREVREETGLVVVEVEGRGGRVVSGDEVGVVECLQPFAAYQTLEGPVDSVGVYFRCSATGSLRSQRGESSDAAWYTVAELRRAMTEEPQMFSWVDRA